MARRTIAPLFFTLLIAACSSRSEAPARRATLQIVGPASIKIIPAEKQYPYCLAYTVSEKGIVRQLTMSPENASFECKAGEPVGGQTYFTPANEGKVRVYVLFSDRKLEALPIGAQVHEMARTPGFTAMDLRAPGLVVMETLEFTPKPKE
jgi:hypothetical protein